MTTGGVREVGVRLKVGAEGTDNLQRLAQALQKLGVDTQALDQQAEALGRELLTAGEGAGKAAIDADKLAAVQQEASKAAQQLADATKQAAGGTTELASNSQAAKDQLANMKIELAAAGATLYTLGLALGSAAKDAAAFETGMAEIATLSEDTSKIDEQAEAIRRLSREYGGDAPSQAKALYNIISAGAQQGAQAVGLLEQANRLAIGGLTDVETAAGTLTGVLNAYGKGIEEAELVSDQLFATVRDGVTTIPELSASIGQVAPIAAQAGVGLEQLLAATAALTKGNNSTSLSVTQLRAIITSVVKPTAEATETAQALGLQFDATALKAKGLDGFLADVAQRTQGNSEVMAKLFGSVEALGGALALTGTQADAFGNSLKAQNDAAGLTESAFGKLAGTSEFASRQFQSALADVRISLGQTVTSFTPLLRVVTDALDLFNNLPEPVKVGVVAVGALAVAIGPLTAAVGSLTRAAGLARTALGLKAAAATSVAAPAAAAAAATTALGAASAAATPGIAAAAGATTLLSRAMTLLKAALPIGLVLTVAQLAAEFLRVRTEAADADKAVEKMLKGSPESGTAKNATAAASALQTVGDAAQASAAKLEQQAGAARLAAQALGVDLARSAGRVSEEFATKLQRLEDIIKGLDALKTQGVSTGNLVAEALEKMVAAARNTQELDALRAKIVQLGTSGEISKGQLDGLMKAVDEQARKASKGVDELADAYKRLGVTSKAELEKTAAENKKAWELIQADATASVATKQAAFKRYADSAIAANSGVADSTLKAEATSLKLAIQADKTGKAIVSGMDKSTAATEQTRRKFTELGQEINSAGQAINQLAGGINGARTRTEDLLGTAAGQARNDSINSSNSINARFNSSTGFLPVTSTGSVYTPPPSPASDYRWIADLKNPRGGTWVLTPEAQARNFAQQQTQLGLVRDTRPGFEGRWVRPPATPAGGSAGQPGGTPSAPSPGSPAPTPAPQPAFAPTPGAPQAEAELEQRIYATQEQAIQAMLQQQTAQAHLLTQQREQLQAELAALRTAGQGRATAGGPGGLVEIRLTGPTGQQVQLQAPNQATAEAFSRLLQDAFRANGGSLS